MDGHVDGDGKGEGSVKRRAITFYTNSLSNEMYYPSAFVLR
jgi:hypothetical protein